MVTTEEKNLATTEINSLENDSGEVLEAVLSVNGREFQLNEKNVDQAMKMALAAEDIELTPERANKLKWKIDLYLIPFFIMVYAVQYMDKITNSFAAVMGIKTDMNMSGTEYSWLGSAFYLGYLVFEVPASMLLQRFPVAKVTSIFIFCWGAVVLLCPATNTPGLLFLRVVLGMMESSITPAMVILTGQWYRKEEHFLRTAIWLGSCSVGSVIGYLISYGLYVHGGDWSIASWKVVYLVIGCWNIVISILFYFHIPDTPSGAWFLTEEEKLMAVKRIKENNQGYGNKTFKKEQFMECLKDYRIWLIFVFGVVNEIPNGGITNFSSILFNSDFGFSVKRSLLLSAQKSTCGFVIIVAFGSLYSLGLIKSRIFVSLLATCVSLTGASMLAFSDSKKARLGGLFIMTTSDLGIICMLSIFQSNVAGHTKKVVGNAIFLIAYCAGNVIGPQTFKANEAPNYPTAKGAIVGCYAASIFLMLVMFASYYFENKMRDKKRDALGDAYVKQENIEFADLTDKQNPEFRYSL
ncbi:CYFA0S12e02344g1_1 [Cyberlindnera fabianii]|uniref:Allantoate permease n=1 Tax=Cyberlindnera fabianii TaxID=36022 RepID=A0A061B6T4_CYBFA|nr:Allantoate permease [Cyberlindnera fabianii]CDR43593.1 CYFA0S12e02344g1_1 [Cyberlindnera fabianii]